ncbi:unnamed protein product [Auanema sp. JU1783]|nr:unnamed protein product [Auanema sp. JU1783]
MFSFWKITLTLIAYWVHVSSAIQCFECTASQGVDCIEQAVKCETGFFGCLKIVAVNGGVDKSGMWTSDQQRRLLLTTRGCSLLPLGNVDVCEQTSILGTRVIKCTCFTDFCNGTNGYHMSWVYLFIVTFLFSLFF